MNTDYDVFYFDNFIERYAATTGKGVIYLRSYGWNNSSDVDAINASMDLYRDLLPLDMFTALQQSEFVFVEVDDLDDTIEFLETTFPESQENCAVPENYIHFSLYNSLGQSVLSN